MRSGATPDPQVYLQHIRDSIRRIERYTAKGRRAFFDSTLHQDAVVRNLEVIGEAVRHLPEEFRRTHPEVPWRSVSALRNVLIHEYFGVDMEAVWGVVKKRIPELRKIVDGLLTPDAGNSAAP
jgi:uncharacterized protein with HEPN domain